MEKKKNNASEMFQLFGNGEQFNGISYIETATVISPLPDLVVQLRNLIYKKENIKLNEYWLKSHKRDVEIPITKLTGSDSRGDAHVQGGLPDAKLIFKDDLKSGDEVAVLQSRDKQTLYILFRIARW